jgi:hypothetical protein
MSIILSFLYLYLQHNISMTDHFITNAFLFISLTEKIHFDEWIF